MDKFITLNVRVVSLEMKTGAQLDLFLALLREHHVWYAFDPLPYNGCLIYVKPEIEKWVRETFNQVRELWLK